MLRIFILVLFSLMTLSCSTALKVSPVHSEFRVKSLKYYVENNGSDGRRLDNMIAQELRIKGYDAASGYKRVRPKDTDILVVYDDQWQWDITDYLIHMRIDIRNPETYVLLGTGSSYQTSAARQNERVIIKNIVSGMFVE